MKRTMTTILSLFSLFELTSQKFQIVENAFQFDAYHIEKKSPVDASFLNSPIDEKKQVIVSKDGHLQADGKRLRIFGTNLSDIPSKKNAAASAQALASQGYNCIRFHHTDASWTHCFLKKNTNGKWVINEERLDDFDYFFNELKKSGIYSNINLLTGREFSSADGLSTEIDSIQDWKHRHCAGFWNQEARNLQKDYAKEILSHKNPYTGLSYLEDPAVAIVEINNENGLLMSYIGNSLSQYKYEGNYWQELEGLWNEWLLKNNLSYEKLAAKYNLSAQTGKTIVDKKSSWNIETHDVAKASVSESEDETTIRIQKNGTANWHVQYNCAGLSLRSDKIYTVSFSAKADSNVQLEVSLMEAHDPWHNAGFHENIALTASWQDFEFSVMGIKTDENLRLNFGNLGLLEGSTIILKDITIVEGGNIIAVETGAKSSPAKKTARLPPYKEFKSLNDEYRNIVLFFLADTEQEYWNDMKDYIRKTLKCKALLMGTIIGCSTHEIQSVFDIIDTHEYFNHPDFPEESWDMSNYYVQNRTITKSENIQPITDLAKNRVFGKPFCVSEYDHPYPNQYSSEMYPLIASFGSFQDWDCIFTFCSSLPMNKNPESIKITGYFDQSENPAKACAAPFAARIFRNFMVKPAEKTIYVLLDEKTERKMLNKNQAWFIGDTELYGMKKNFALKHKVGVVLADKKTGISGENIPPSWINANTYTDESEKLASRLQTIGNGVFSDTNELYFENKSGVILVNTDELSVSILDNNSILPDIPSDWKQDDRFLPFEPADDFSTVITIKENDIYIVYACSWCGNKGEQLREYGGKNESRKLKKSRSDISLTTIGTLGTGPAVTLSCDGKIILNGENKYQLLKLNKNGLPEKEFSQPSNSFTINAEDGTLWFLIKSSQR